MPENRRKSNLMTKSDRFRKKCDQGPCEDLLFLYLNSVNSMKVPIYWWCLSVITESLVTWWVRGLWRGILWSIQLLLEGIVVLVLHVMFQASSSILHINKMLASWNIANSNMLHFRMKNRIIHAVVLPPFRGELRTWLD